MGKIAEKLTKCEAEDVCGKVESFKEYILKNHAPERIYWFGSSLDGDMNGYSDIDLAVLFEDKVSLLKARSDMLNWTRSFDIDFDLLFFLRDHFDKKAETGGICLVVKETGKVIYDKEA